MKFCTVYSLFGVPIFALLLSVLSGLIVEAVETEKLQKRLSSPITEAQFNYVDQVLGQSELDFGGFLILTLAKLGKMDNKLLKTIKDRFDFLDVDGDGAFSKKEMEVMVEFERFDSDNSGEIEIEEFTKVIMQLNHKMPGIFRIDPVNILEMYNQIDDDKDGTISKNEFLGWWRGITSKHDKRLTSVSGRTAVEEQFSPPSKPSVRMSTDTFNTLFGGGVRSSKAKTVLGHRRSTSDIARATWADDTPRGKGGDAFSKGNAIRENDEIKERDKAADVAARTEEREKRRRQEKRERRSQRKASNSKSNNVKGSGLKEARGVRPSTQTGMTQMYGDMAL